VINSIIYSLRKMKSLESDNASTEEQQRLGSKRSCTDKIFLILFLTLTVYTGLIKYKMSKSYDIHRLLRVTDTDGIFLSDLRQPVWVQRTRRV